MNLVDKKNIGILVYGRFPTEKAYGSHLIEIAKAFRDKGGNATVFYSKTYNSKTIFTTPDSYYGNCERINFKELKNIDFTNSPLFLRLPSSIQKLIWNFGAIYWSFSIKKYLKNQDFLWSTNPNILVPLTKLKSVIIYEKHGAAKYIQKLSIKYIASYEKTILVGTTKKSYEELSSIRSKNKSIYLPNGVNLSEYKQIEKNKNHIINIGYIGMLETYGKGKGVEEAINKLIEISKNRKILITVIGGPVERISKIRSVLTENNIDFIVKDRIPSYEVPIEMKRLDIGIVPYPNEEHMSLYASPLKFFEYAAAGAAILSSDIQSHLDLKDLNLGIHYFEESNWNDFETKIIELIDNKDLLKILQNKSQENIEEHTWDKRIEKILNCMRL